jgi:hypothetical protein
MEKMNVSTAAGEMRRPPASAYDEAAAGEDTDTLSELSENELLYGFLNPNPLPSTAAALAGQVQGPNASLGD